jgi:hypothetical protein
MTAVFEDRFSECPHSVCFPDGAEFGLWRSVFHGYGCNEIVQREGESALRLCPQASSREDETHAGLVVGPSRSGPFRFELEMLTARPLRVGSPPHPWEVAWAIWNYLDPVHFTYFILKPNGWELGEADPAYPGAQRFLETGSRPFPIGRWHSLDILQRDDEIEISANGELLTRYRGDRSPNREGRIGLYCEDAEVFFRRVRLSP